MTTKATKHATEKVAVPPKPVEEIATENVAVSTKPVAEIATENVEEIATENVAVSIKPAEQTATENVAEIATENVAVSIKPAEQIATENVAVSIKPAEQIVTEKVAVPTKPVEEVAAGSLSLIGLVRQLLLAYVGAVALTRDEIEAFLNKLVERGELAQKDAEKLLREVSDQPGAKKAGEQVEQGIEEVLNRLNIPSRRDLAELNARIGELATSVEELDKSSRSR